MLQQIETDLVAAMKAGETLTRDTLRMLKSALKNTQIDTGAAELTDQQIQEVIAKEVKKRKEAVAAYEQANKPELVSQEQAELAILSAYLPTQLSQEEISAKVEDYIKSNPTTLADMGRAMSELKAQLGGNADMGQVAQILKSLL